MTTHPLVVTSYPLLTYAPLFVAQRQGLFEARDLPVVTRRHSGRWSDLIGLLDDGGSDVILGNAWFALRATATEHPKVIVAPCGQQCRFVLATAVDGQLAHGFDWSALAGRTVIVPTGIPTPWFAFTETLARLGISTDRVRVLVGYDDDEAVAEVLSHRVDYMLTDLDTVQNPGLCEVAAPADVLGPVPWSVFCARVDTVERDPQRYQRFRAGIGEALAWMRVSSADEIAETIKPDYTALAPETCIAAIRRYKALEVWPADEKVSTEALSAWEGALLANGGLSMPSDLKVIAPFDPVAAP